MGVTSLVLGFISIFAAIVCFGFQWVAVVIGIIGIVLGAMECKQNPLNKGVAIAGIVINSIGTVLGILFYSACVACVGCLKIIF